MFGLLDEQVGVIKLRERELVSGSYKTTGAPIGRHYDRILFYIVWSIHSLFR